MIPGAVMLDDVVAAIAGDGHDGAVTIHGAKFLNIVRPGACIHLRWQTIAGGAIKFECRLAGQDDLAMAGTLEIGPLPP